MCSFGIIADYLLPSPLKVAKAFAKSFGELMQHAKTSLLESFFGLTIGLILACVLAVAMDRFNIIHRMVYPLLVISQAVPVVAIAPLLVLWGGYGIAPKVVLIIIVCFFPIVIGLLDGLRSADKDQINLLRAMGANRWQIFWHIKLPGALPSFFPGFKVSVSFSIVGAVIAEWLGGNSGLGVYMTRVRKSYSYDKMFAVIFLVVAISLILVWLAGLLEKLCMPWKNKKRT
ncbi:MAG TPA: ABC transporter permease [Clostridiales bacterium]|nr:ABC transporter permease [Clostridiales bacterium]